MKCEKCKKEHDGSFASGRFCNCSCAHGFSTMTKRKEINKKVSKKLKGRNKGKNPFIFTPEINKKRIENLILTHRRKFIKYIERWIEGKENGNIKCGYSSKIKKYLIEKYNNRCMKCEWSEINKTTKKVPLEIHHIDGDCYNNTIENIELLCPNCHSLTSTFKASNKMSTRKYTIRYKHL